jgi:hypothetical protein
VSELRILGPKTVENLSPAPPEPEGVNLAKKARITASYTSKYDKLEELTDGVSQHKPNPRNRWTCWDSKNGSDWLEFAWEAPTKLTHAELAIFDDGGGVKAPKTITLEAWLDGGWKSVQGVQANPKSPRGKRRNILTFPPVETTKLRMTFQHQQGSYSGLTEVKLR